MFAQLLGIALVTAFTGLLLVLRQSIGNRRTGRWPRQAFLFRLSSRNTSEDVDPLPEWPESIDLVPVNLASQHSDIGPIATANPSDQNLPLKFNTKEYTNG